MEIALSMALFTLRVNKKNYEVETEAGTPLLWVLREGLGLTGTKYGCGIGQCGACTIHVNGDPMKACLLPVDNFSDGQEIVTIEGLSEDGAHPVQKAWVEAQAPQCGYCQSGQIMQAAALLEKNPSPSQQEIKSYMNGNLCRCGTYLRILKAIQLASENKLAGL
jgi:isoquinoline 1-oxidoreductase alpha subunit